jgi:hypothetical protein
MHGCEVRGSVQTQSAACPGENDSALREVRGGERDVPPLFAEESGVGHLRHGGRCV